nr:hypothetical protein [Waterburya agarophytonicola]
MKGDKVVAFCDRNCNVISPFVTAFRTIERVFAWEDKFKRLLLRFERKAWIALCPEESGLHYDQSSALLSELILSLSVLPKVFMVET